LAARTGLWQVATSAARKINWSAAKARAWLLAPDVPGGAWLTRHGE
jgi:hypothetical protein